MQEINNMNSLEMKSIIDPLVKLSAVAAQRNIAELHSLLRDDPLLLEKATLLPHRYNMLHIACLAGDLDFVRDILGRKPCFAWGGNKDGLTPLHMASALGHDEIVDVLLEVGQAADHCRLQDKEGMTPLHYAAGNGNVSVIHKLLSKCLEAYEIETSKGETALHLALKNNHADAFRELAEGLKPDMRFIGKHWTSIKQLAKETGQLKELDVFHISSSTRRFRLTMAQLWYVLAVIFRPIDAQIVQLVASLIATVTFQAVVSPPAAIWSQGMKMDYKCLIHRPASYSWRKRMIEYCPSSFYLLFMISNTAGFFSAIGFLMWFKTTAVGGYLMGVSLFSLLFSYLILLEAMSPDVYSFVIISFASLVFMVILMILAMFCWRLFRTNFLILGQKLNVY